MIGSSDIDDSGISNVVVLVSTAAGSVSRSSGPQLVLSKNSLAQEMFSDNVSLFHSLTSKSFDSH